MTDLERAWIEGWNAAIEAAAQAAENHSDGNPYPTKQHAIAAFIRNLRKQP